MTLETIKNDNANSEGLAGCKFRPEGVICAKKGRKCYKCGWNPGVEQKRIERLRERSRK